MEALLKLIVGLDGVTADMIVQLGYIYLVAQLLEVIGFVSIFSVLGYTVLKCVMWCNSKAD